MVRIVIQELAIFVMPMLLYGAYFLWRRRQARVAGNPEPVWEQGHWFWLIAVGLALAIAAFIIGEALVTHDPNAIRNPKTTW
jgi:hypothetical protein